MNKTWWIPTEKQFLPETKKWYCSNCGNVTGLERNLEWNGDYEGKDPAPEWFVRCAECKGEHWQSSGIECPDCGWDDLPDEAEEHTEMRSNIAASMQFGGNPMEWEEKYHCPFCDNDFWIGNSNY